MKKAKLLQIIEEICPSALAEPWDNCGFQIDTGVLDYERALVALEVTSEVIDEAEAEGADIIITHHPLIFEPLKHVYYNEFIGNSIFELLSNGISVYSCHTTFDKTVGGNNDYIGELLKLKDVRPFENDNGFCRRGDTAFETTFIEMCHLAADAFDIDEKYFRTVGKLTSLVNTVGWCSGAGGEFIADALREGCDLYITGDLKHHEAQLALESGLCVLDAGHYGTEKIFTENMAAKLRTICCREDQEIEIVESQADSNPFNSGRQL